MGKFCKIEEDKGAEFLVGAEAGLAFLFLRI